MCSTTLRAEWRHCVCPPLEQAYKYFRTLTHRLGWETLNKANDLLSKNLHSTQLSAGLGSEHLHLHANAHLFRLQERAAPEWGGVKVKNPACSLHLLSDHDFKTISYFPKLNQGVINLNLTSVGKFSTRGIKRTLNAGEGMKRTPPLQNPKSVEEYR